MYILIFIIILCTIVGLIYSTVVTNNEKFFSLSGALYGPKEIPLTDTCSCTQLEGSQELIPKQKVPIRKCASCHLN
jgi:hypothetical protein